MGLRAGPCKMVWEIGLQSGPDGTFFHKNFFIPMIYHSKQSARRGDRFESYMLG